MRIPQPCKHHCDQLRQRIGALLAMGVVRATAVREPFRLLPIKGAPHEAPLTVARPTSESTASAGSRSIRQHQVGSFSLKDTGAECRPEAPE